MESQKLAELVWSQSLKQRISSEQYLDPATAQSLAIARLQSVGIRQSVSDGNHLRLNSFWLFVGVGNSASEEWGPIPRKHVTLGNPHVFETVDESDPKVARARYHKQVRKALDKPFAAGFVAPRKGNGLSYGYVGNLNVSDLVAGNERTVVVGHHLSFCGHWAVTEELLESSTLHAKQLGWTGVN